MAFNWKYLIPGYAAYKVGKGAYDESRARDEAFASGREGYQQRGGQLDEATELLRQQATGEKSFSSEMLRQALGRNVAAQHSLAASARPGYEGLAARMAAQQAGALGAGLAGQQTLAGIAERQAAQQALMQAILGGRGQDVSVLTQGMGQPGTYEKLLNAGAQATQFLAQASDRRQKTDIRPLGEGRNPMFVRAMRQAPYSQTGGPGTTPPDEYVRAGLVQPGGVIETARDEAERAKTRAFLEALKPYSYRYRPGAGPPGRQVGVMAQDLEKSKAGKQLVAQTPAGKIVDYSKAGPIFAAALADINRRLGKVEGK